MRLTDGEREIEAELQRDAIGEELPENKCALCGARLAAGEHPAVLVEKNVDGSPIGGWFDICDDCDSKTQAIVLPPKEA